MHLRSSIVATMKKKNEEFSGYCCSKMDLCGNGHVLITTCRPQRMINLDLDGYICIQPDVMSQIRYILMHTNYILSKLKFSFFIFAMINFDFFKNGPYPPYMPEIKPRETSHNY